MGKTKHGKTSPPAAQPAIYYSLHTLLETIRVIKLYEDPLCTLLHDIQSAGGASAEVAQELRTMLDEMPAAAYTLELDGVRRTLDEAGGASEGHRTQDGRAAGKLRTQTPARAKGPAKRTARPKTSPVRG